MIAKGDVSIVLELRLDPDWPLRRLSNLPIACSKALI